MNSQAQFQDKKVGRNAPCPCGSGKKYKKCCLGTDNDPSLNAHNHMAKCAICKKAFDRRLIGTFESIEREGQRIYFCPDCNYDLACNICNKKLGEMSFELYSCADCGVVKVVCESCVKKGDRPSSHCH